MIVEWKVRLTYPPQLLERPLIYELIQQFGLLTNILEAHVNSDVGWLIVAVRGEREMVQQGVKWVSEQGVEVEIIAKSEEAV